MKLQIMETEKIELKSIKKREVHKNESFYTRVIKINDLVITLFSDKKENLQFKYIVK